MKVTLEEIIEKFEALFPRASIEEAKVESSAPKLPSGPLKKDDLSANFSVKVKEPRTQLDQKFGKTSIFKERVAEIVEIIDPETKWAILEEKREPTDPRIQNVNPLNGSLRQYVMSRFMGGNERERERRPEPHGEINVSQIIDRLPIYEERVPVPVTVSVPAEEKIDEEKPVEKPAEEKPVEGEPVIPGSAIDEERPAQMAEG